MCQKRDVGTFYEDKFVPICMLGWGNEYTNHSIRATVIATLDCAGFEDRHIITLSSHKSESTVKEYATKCPENKRKEMFNSLSNAMMPKAKRTKGNATATSTTTPTSTNTLPQLSVQDIKENLPTFQLEPVDFSTIDDSVLASLTYDYPDTNPQQQNQNIQHAPVAAALNASEHEINAPPPTAKSS